MGPSSTVSSPTSRAAWCNRRTPRQAPTPQRPNVADSVDNSASHTRGVPHIGEPATPTPAAWVEIFGRRLSLWEEQQVLLPQHPNLPAAPPTVLVDCAHLIAKTHAQAYPFGANSMVNADCLSCCRLLHPRKFAAPHPLAILIVLFPRCQVWEVCLALSLHQSVSNSPARA